MAEKYGTIPKKFTKAWWEYFWEYYKVHTIVSAVVVVAVVSTIYGVLTAPKYDFYMTYATGGYIDNDSVNKVGEVLSEYIEDTNQNGEKLVSSSCYTFSDGEQDAQYLSTMITKLHLDFVVDEVMLFVFSEDKTKYYFDSNSLSGAFKPVGEWVTDKNSDLKTYSFYGEEYAVSLENSKVLKDAGIKCDDLYVAVRAYETDDEEVKSRMRSAIAVANELIK
ncbi:MAG: hypothetical protein IJD30_01090 [Clostridia bacterium]|nr:hypothetical protein [Clostridia bacterium]